jgi:RNA polymerase sigma-70 factor (ECF subfamily)
LGRDGATDGELVAELRGGRPGAFDELMRRHEDRIFALTLRITGNREDALEATQETFLTLWRKVETFEGRSEVGTWLYRVGINAARDVLRRKMRRPVPIDHSLAEEVTRERAPDPAGAVVARVDVGRALASLPAEYAEAVALHDLGDLTYEDIAAIADVALGTVKSRISRGRRLLAARLERTAPAPASKEPR